MAVTDPAFNPSGNPDIAAIKEASNALAAVIEKLPPSRRRAVALTNLETASMWAVKAAAVGGRLTNEATMTVCKKCQGKGAMKPAPYPSRRDLPCFWFADGARKCPNCDGTGETDGGRDGRT